jgi:hypothetical protein
MANGESLQSVKQGTTMTRGGFSEEWINGNLTWIEP